MKRSLIVAGALLTLVAALGAQNQRSTEAQFKAAQHQEEVEGDLRGAIDAYKKLAQTSDRAVAAKALLRMAACYLKLGDNEARAVYQRIVREFADQTEPASAAQRGLASLASSSAAAAVGPVNRQIWAGVTNLYATSPSNDGRYLSFTDWETGDLAIRDLRTGTTRQLTNKGGWKSADYADQSLVSRDGRRVVYTWFDSTSFKTDLRVIAVGGDRVDLPRIVHNSDETAYIVPSDWTPDGNHVLIIRALADQTNQIAIMSLRDGSTRAIKSLDWRWPSRASLSPDGRYVAYDVPAGDDVPAREIFVLAADGSRETVVVQHRANDHSPVWSPDGTHIVFLSDRTGSRSLWSIPAAEGRPTGPPTLVRRDAGDLVPLGMTREGALYYVARGARNNVYVAELDGQMKATAAPVLATDRYLHSNNTPAWSPDGESLAYLSQRSLDGPGSFVLVIRSLKNGEERDIPLRLNIRPLVLKWFPDGRSVLVAARDLQKSRFSYYRVDVGRRDAQLLHSTNTRVRNGNLADLSPDGDTIFYVDSDAGSGAEQLMRFDINARRTRVLQSVPAVQYCSLAVSPDGETVAYVATNLPMSEGPTTLAIMPANGGDARVVLRDKRWGPRFAGMTWTPDSRALLFVKSDDEAPASPALWRVAVRGEAPARVGIAVKALGRPQLHPDGHRLAFHVDESGPNEVWALENFLARAPERRK